MNLNILTADGWHPVLTTFPPADAVWPDTPGGELVWNVPTPTHYRVPGGWVAVEDVLDRSEWSDVEGGKN